MSIRIILKNGTAIEVDDVQFSEIEKKADAWAPAKTLTLTDSVIIYTSEISHILNTGKRKDGAS